MKTVTIYAHYHKHDTYKIPLRSWETKLAEYGGDTDAALRSFIDWGVDPIDDNITNFHTEVGE
jgi:hypothetical protein